MMDPEISLPKISGVRWVRFGNIGPIPIPIKNSATEDTVTGSGSINNTIEISIMRIDVCTTVHRLSFFVRNPDKNRPVVNPI